MELLLALIFCLACGASGERLVECPLNGTVVNVDEGDYVRLVSENYSSYVFYKTRFINCQLSFLAASGKDLKISFVSGVYNELYLYGVKEVREEAPDLRVHIDTTHSYGAKAEQHVYHAGSNLTLVAYTGSTEWTGFQAIVSVERNDTCTANASIDLRGTYGPVDFGTTWKDRTAPSGPNVCSWVITADSGKSLKLFVKRANIRTNESLYVVDSNNKRTTIELYPKPYYFTDVHSITVVYERSGPDSETRGISALASWMDKQNFSSTFCSKKDENNNFNITKGDYTNCGSSCEFLEYRQYSDYTECSWSLVLPHGHEGYGSFQVNNIETFCDSVELVANLTTYSITETREFIVPRNTADRMTVAWSSDGNIEFNGFSAWIYHIDCACVLPKITLPYDGILYSNAGDDHMYCDNIHCEHEVSAPDGFSIIALMTANLRNETEDSLAVGDGYTRLFSSIGGTYTSEPILSSRGYMRFVLDSQKYSFGPAKGYWLARFQTRKEMEVTTYLNSTFPAAARVATLTAVWTITAVNHVILYGSLNVRGSSDAARFQVHEGTAAGDIIGTLQDLQLGKTLESNGSSLTIVEKGISIPDQYHVVYAADSAETHDCNRRPTMLPDVLYPEYVPVRVNGSTTPCSLSLFTDRLASSGFYCDTIISLFDISITLGANKEPVRVIAGPIRQAALDDVELFAFREDTVLSGMPFFEDVITIVLPEGSSIVANASLVNQYCPTSLHYSQTVDDLSAEGFLSSYYYPEQNFMYYRSEFFNLTSAGGITNISIELTVDLPNGAELFINSSSEEHLWFTNTSFKQQIFYFKAKTLIVTYTRVMRGEKGFLLKYKFGGLLPNITTTASTSLSSPTYETTSPAATVKSTSSKLPSTQSSSTGSTLTSSTSATESSSSTSIKTSTTNPSTGTAKQSSTQQTSSSVMTPTTTATKGSSRLQDGSQMTIVAIATVVLTVAFM